MRHQRLRLELFMLILLSIFFSSTSPVRAQEETTRNDSPTNVLTDSEWDEVNLSIDRALQWLASRQQRDGSFPTAENGQPGVTGLCTLAFLAQGHLPNEGKYGQVLAKSLDFITDCQRKNGLLAANAPNGAEITRVGFAAEIGVTTNYNHAIAGLVLCESYAMSGAETAEKIQPVIEKALNASFKMHDWPTEQAVDVGGWRYLHDAKEYKPHLSNSDLSVTGWQLMFLRSAKNAGFDVQQGRIERTVGYVRRCFKKDQATFVYNLDGRGGNRTSRGLAGAGILALAHSGLHQTDEAQQAGDWILKSGFRDYNAPGRLKNDGVDELRDPYFYGLLTCGPAMYQLGGRHWRTFFPPAVEVLMKNQNANGSWASESHAKETKWGKSYTTAIGVLALSSTNELLPIFQR